MKKVFVAVVVIVGVFFLAQHTLAIAPKIVINPTQIEQGDPFMITIQHVTKVSSIKSITFAGSKEGIFLYKSAPTAMVGVDIHKKAGTYTVVVTMTNGTVLKQSVVIQARPQDIQPLGIPAKLGGDTTASAKNIVDELAKEAVYFSKITTNKKSLWTLPFIYPVPNPIVTDPYGYTRQTDGYDILHKGTDLRAPEGTPIMAINRGIVRIVKSNSVTYGNTVVVDHGQGITSFYLHLSKFNVKVGDIVKQGQIIGWSGQTGYALGPHLHLTIRINNVAIDPVKFLALFK